MNVNVEETGPVERRLHIEIPTTDAIARNTAVGTATRSTRTIRLWRAALAKRASSPGSKVGLRTEFTAAPKRSFAARSAKMCSSHP